MRFSSIAGTKGIFVDGDWIEKKDQDTNGKVRLIQLADVGAGVFLDKSDRYLTKQKAIDLHCTFLKKGDILIARLGEPLCKTCIFPYEGLFITAVDIAILRIGNSSVNSKYIVYLLNSPWFKDQVKKYESGTTRKRISRKNLDRIEMDFPPLSEQERIVAKIEELFSQLDAGVETLKKIKAQLAIYRQAVLKEAFEGIYIKQLSTDGRLMRIDEFANVDTGATPKTTNKSYYGGTIAWVASGKINEKRIYSPTDYITELALKETNCKVFPAGTLLIAMYGEGQTRGKCAELMIPAATNQALAAITLNDNSPVVKSFLKWFLIYNYQLIRRKAAGGVQPNLNLGIIKAIQINVFSKSAQEETVKQIESRFSVCDNIEQTVDASLQQADALRQSILKDAFEGRL